MVTYILLLLSTSEITTKCQRPTLLALKALLISSLAMTAMVGCQKEDTQDLTTNGTTAEVDLTPRIKAFIRLSKDDIQYKDNSVITL